MSEAIRIARRPKWWDAENGCGRSVRALRPLDIAGRGRHGIKIGFHDCRSAHEFQGSAELRTALEMVRTMAVPARSIDGGEP